MSGPTGRHLWEYDHPFYGSDANSNECESFAELRESVDALDEGMNHVYRWDWLDWSAPQHASLLVEGEEPSPAEFAVFLVLPRKSMLICFSCPIAHEQEPEVLAWLRSDRIAGALRRLWEPTLRLDDDVLAEHG